MSNNNKVDNNDYNVDDDDGDDGDIDDIDDDDNDVDDDVDAEAKKVEGLIASQEKNVTSILFGRHFKKRRFNDDDIWRDDFCSSVADILRTRYQASFILTTIS